jgi:hypothetical protein
MQFGQRFNGRNGTTSNAASATDVIKENPFVGLATLNTMSGLKVLKDQAAIKQAFELRNMARVLGMPPDPLKDDDMMAAGDININRGGSNFGPWLFAAACVIAMAIGFGVLVLMLVQQSPAAPVTPPATTTGQYTIDGRQAPYP